MPTEYFNSPAWSQSVPMVAAARLGLPLALGQPLQLSLSFFFFVKNSGQSTEIDF